MHICGKQRLYLVETECDDCAPLLEQLKNVDGELQALERIEVTIDDTTAVVLGRVEEAIRRDPPVFAPMDDVTIEVGEAFDPLEGVSATDMHGNPAVVTYEGDYDVNVPGIYVLTYTATDEYGETATETRVLTVKQWLFNEHKTTIFEDKTMIINEYLGDRDANIAAHGSVVYEFDPWDKNNPETSYVYPDFPWHYEDHSLIETVRFGSEVQPRSMMRWFATWPIKYFYSENLDTSKMTSIVGLFLRCADLEYVDTANWDTSSLTNTESAFQECANLVSLDTSNWDLNNVTNAHAMFWQTSALNSLDVSNWGMSSLENGGTMFSRCLSLTEIDVSKWDVSSLTNAMDMFANCRQITTLDLSQWDTQNLTATSRMFEYCTNLRTIYASEKFNTSKVPLNSSQDMFYNCTSLVGGAGTIYYSYFVNKTYARIDDPPSLRGYFTRKD